MESEQAKKDAEPKNETTSEQKEKAAESQGDTEAETESESNSEEEQVEADAESQDGQSDGEKKQRFFNVYNIIGLVLCVLLLPFFIISSTLLVSSLIHSDIPPSCFGYTPLMVETGSMSPVFDEGDLLLIHITDDDATYEAGDIICFHSGNTYVTHRIKEIATDEDGTTVYITQGDANNAPDERSVQADQILGVYAVRLKGMGKVFLFIQTPLGMIVCVMLPIILVLLLFLIPPLIAARKEAKEAKAEKDENGKEGSDGEESEAEKESAESSEEKDGADKKEDATDGQT